eukprot:CAMPEP_0197445098 /NCGR_PEP_ID=MMETSP1175-20131217/10401_1 /TAXON_ID=1003142 /ORGANISM="Triceratium dubium, Strain CCMP147" /LENGTH=78 /DNA_ID=CAMNT_0042976001 /DNA_START=19 /DNA_END=252 /DNA_ORIENTATION=-
MSLSKQPCRYAIFVVATTDDVQQVVDELLNDENGEYKYVRLTCRNGLGPIGAEAIADVIRRNRTIEGIDLGLNEMGDA